MIYIFNSGLRGIYRRNVLNTLLLPEGFVNRYRYRSRGARTDVGARVNINPNDHDRLLNSEKGTEIAIVFIDRFTKPYRYFPFRLGSLVRVEEDGHQMYFSVKMGPFVWSHSPDTTSQRLWEKFEKSGIPRLTNDSPKNENDGYYAILGDSLFVEEGLYEWGDEAWDNIAKAFSGMAAFQPIAVEPQFALFARAKLLEGDGISRVSPKINSKGLAYYDLSRDRGYVLSLRYFYPAQEKDPTNEARVSVNASDSIQRLPESPILVSTPRETAVRRLAVKRTEDRLASIDFDFQRSSSPGVFGADAALVIQIRDTKRFWFATGLTMFFFVAGGAAIAMNVPEGQTATWTMYFAQLTAVKAVGAIVQAACLVILTRLMGKRVL